MRPEYWTYLGHLDLLVGLIGAEQHSCEKINFSQYLWLWEAIMQRGGVLWSHGCCIFNFLLERIFSPALSLSPWFYGNLCIWSEQINKQKAMVCPYSPNFKWFMEACSCRANIAGLIKIASIPPTPCRLFLCSWCVRRYCNVVVFFLWL